jgi:prepilin-type N-terminal cleavage/methylation domain-containing protein
MTISNRGVDMKVTYYYLKDNKGFSLLEMLIAIATGLIVMAAIMTVTRSGLFSSMGIQSKVATQQDTQLALQMMALEIGMASYDANGANDWHDLSSSGTGCQVSSLTSQDLKKGIREATQNSITIEADLNGNESIGNPGPSPSGDPNEVIRYVYVPSDQYISRCTGTVTGGNGQPFLGDTIASGRPRTVRVINNTLGIPLFRYFYSNGTQFTPNASQTNCQTNPPNDHICNIHRIDITIAAETDEVDPSTGTRKRMIYSTSVIPRNHVIR